MTVSIVHEFIFLNIIPLPILQGNNNGIAHSERRPIFFPVTHSRVAFDYNFCLQMGTNPVPKSYLFLT